MQNIQSVTITDKKYSTKVFQSSNLHLID